MSDGPDLEVIFESFLFKLPAEATSSVLQSSWHKKYFVLLRDSTSPRLCYYNKKPRTIHDPPKGVIELGDHYQVERKSSVKGKEFVCLLKTALRDVYLAAEKEHILTLFTFFLMTQTKLQDALEAECFVVRPENSDDHRKIGSRGSMCLMHVSSWGITLALQVSKCILVQWPLRCIRTYESTGKGRFVLEVGNSAPTGSGSFAFNTRLGQDSILYDRIDSQANQQAAMQDLMSSRDARSPMDLIAISYQGLASLTYVQSDCGSIAQSKRISRDIYDHLAEYLGSSTNILSSAVTAASAPVNIPLPPVPGSRNLKESATRSASADKNVPLPSQYLHVGKKLSPSTGSDRSVSSASSSNHPLLSRAATSPPQASFANSAYDMEKRESKNQAGDPADYVLQYHHSNSLPSPTGGQSDVVDSFSRPYVNASAVAQRQESRESNASDYTNMSGNKRQSDSSGNRPTSSNGQQQTQRGGGGGSGAFAKTDDKIEANAAVYSYAQTPDFTRLSSRSSMPESVAVARAETDLQQTSTATVTLNSSPSTFVDGATGIQLGQIAANAAVGATNRVSDGNGMLGAEVRASLGGGGGGGERESRQQADNSKLAPGIKMSAKSRVFSRKSAPDTTEV